MKIGGIQKTSFVDYPGKISSVVFLQGCNFDCFYCHNRSLLGNEKKELSKAAILELLKKRKKYIDAIVVSGGEPTIYEDLLDFFIELKTLGFDTKLDTNGTNPIVINELLNQDLVDYIAMDIKAPFKKYDNIVCRRTDLNKIKNSIELIKSSDINYEFRTTFIPQLNKLDIIAIAEEIKGAKRYVLQQYKIPTEYKPYEKFRVLSKPHSSLYINETADNIKKYFDEVVVKD